LRWSTSSFSGEARKTTVDPVWSVAYIRSPLSTDDDHVEPAARCRQACLPVFSSMHWATPGSFTM
jgi:hypothetical protein